MPNSEEAAIENVLKGKTLQVYCYLLKRGEESSVGVREVQRVLNFSSPRLAAYHLEKLERLGLVENRKGDYYLVREIKVGVLKHFSRFGKVLLPRYLFYATLFSTFLIYITIRFSELGASSMLALIISLIGSAIFWYETWRTWREKP